MRGLRILLCTSGHGIGEVPYPARELLRTASAAGGTFDRRLSPTLAVIENGARRASAAFAAWPERTVLVAADGRIVYPGSPGPWGFSPDEAREPLVAQLDAPGGLNRPSRS